MITELMIGLAAITMPVQDSDTVVSVSRGTRLEVRNRSGEIRVRSWERDEVRIAARHSRGDRISIDESGALLEVRSESRRGPPKTVDYDVTVPRWMDLDLSGTFTDVTVEGVDGEVFARTVHGDITLSGGSGEIEIETTQGEVVVTGAEGRIFVSSTNGDVRITDAVGDVRAETINGEVTLERVDAETVEAITVNGDVWFDGVIRERGRYHLNTHNGDVTISIDESVDARVTIATVRGEFQSDIPVTITGTDRGKRISFTMGTGSARVELESFGGTIWLRRGERR